MRSLATLAAIIAIAGSTAVARAAETPIKIVAAENFYGDIARQIGGANVDVTSVLNNPDQDPHLFEASPSIATAIAAAKIVIYNGLNYDPWMVKLLSASKPSARSVIVVGDLLHRKTGANPHLWYDPPTAPAVAGALAAALSHEDPAHRADYEQRLQAFEASLRPIADQITALRKSAAGLEVAATEPVFGYMASALGLKMRNEHFQLSVMNNTEPSASDVAAFENDLKTKRVKLLFYNSQATDPAAQRLLKLAQEKGIPVVGVTETEPPGKSFQQWLEDELEAVQRALPGGT